MQPSVNPMARLTEANRHMPQATPTNMLKESTHVASYARMHVLTTFDTVYCNYGSL